MKRGAKFLVGRAGLWVLAGLCCGSFHPIARAATSVTLSSPADGQAIVAPGSVVLGAVADGSVEWVDFYHDGRLVGWAEEEPFAIEWSGLPFGAYTVEARAYDDSGQVLVSEPVSFFVVEESWGSLTRGPYLMMGHFTNRSTIVWRTDAPTDSWVEYGLSSAYGLAAGSPEPVFQHEVALTNLSPGQTYHYRVRSGGRVLASAVFRSGKSPGTPVRIAWIADHRSGAGGPIAEAMRSYKPDLVLDAGDLSDWCDEGLLDSQFFSAFGGLMSQCPLYWSPGNHEGSGCPPCIEAFGLLPEDHQSYSIEYGDVQAISLNSEDLPSPAWLREKLAGSDKPWKFVFTHVPSYSAGGGHGEYEGTYIRAHYVPLMEEYRVAACITGHSHYYWRSQPINGVTHLVIGSGGAPIYRLGRLPPYTAGSNDLAQVFGYADIDGDFMHFRAVDQYNTQVDETLFDRRCAFQLDGLLDASAALVARREGGLALWAAVSGRYLYLATSNALAQDHFILLSRELSEQTAALGPVWAKDGQVMRYDAFLAGHGASFSNGCFNSGGNPYGNLRAARSATRISKDGVLEGVIDLQALYGGVPPRLYLAAAPYGANPGGRLDPSQQCPAGDGDEDLQPWEFVGVNTAAIALGSGRLTGIVLSPEGWAILDFLGESGATYEIQASTDLMNWRRIGIQIADVRGRFTFTDYEGGSSLQQFYRTRLAAPAP